MAKRSSRQDQLRKTFQGLKSRVAGRPAPKLNRGGGIRASPLIVFFHPDYTVGPGI
jgi:hypothetical protein